MRYNIIRGSNLESFRDITNVSSLLWVRCQFVDKVESNRYLMLWRQWWPVGGNSFLRGIDVENLFLLNQEWKGPYSPRFDVQETCKTVHRIEEAKFMLKNCRLGQKLLKFWQTLRKGGLHIYLRERVGRQREGRLGLGISFDVRPLVVVTRDSTSSLRKETMSVMTPYSESRRE